MFLALALLLAPLARAATPDPRVHATMAEIPSVFIFNALDVVTEGWELHLQQSQMAGSTGPEYGDNQVWIGAPGRPAIGAPMPVTVSFVQVHDPSQPVVLGPARNITTGCTGTGTVTFTALPKVPKALPKEWAQLGPATATVDVKVDCGGDHAKFEIGTDKYGTFTVTGLAADVPTSAAK